MAGRKKDEKNALQRVKLAREKAARLLRRKKMRGAVDALVAEERLAHLRDARQAAADAAAGDGAADPHSALEPGLGTPLILVCAHPSCSSDGGPPAMRANEPTCPPRCALACGNGGACSDGFGSGGGELKSSGTGCGRNRRTTMPSYSELTSIRIVATNGSRAQS